jgi:hypothetical protein
MRGELLPVWAETWRHIWTKLSQHPDAPEDLFPELFRAWTRVPTPPVEPVLTGDLDHDGRLVRPEDIRAREDYETALTAYGRDRAHYEETIGDAARAKFAFRKILPAIANSEAEAVSVLERSFKIVEQSDTDSIRNRYFNLVESFLAKFSLRYDLRRPFTLHPTLPGIFARMVTELKVVTRADAHLQQLMQDFEDAIRDLRADTSSNRIRTCIQRQVNLLEALGQACPTVTENTLGRICDQLGTLPNTVWPHDRVREAMKDLYKFACDYPGIRHGGTPANARRDIDMRDMVAISVLLAGFTPYLSHQVDSNIVYSG